jgi:hypothetical protein
MNLIFPSRGVHGRTKFFVPLLTALADAVELALDGGGAFGARACLRAGDVRWWRFVPFCVPPFPSPPPGPVLEFGLWISELDAPNPTHCSKSNPPAFWNSRGIA